jgi:hypothetical protein
MFNSNMLDEIEKFYLEPILPGAEKFINVVPFERYAAQGGKIKVVRAEGEYLDVGTVGKWLHANIRMAKSQGIEFMLS